jgi:hypothetical protein
MVFSLRVISIREVRVKRLIAHVGKITLIHGYLPNPHDQFLAGIAQIVHETFVVVQFNCVASVPDIIVIIGDHRIFFGRPRLTSKCGSCKRYDEYEWEDEFCSFHKKCVKV